MDNEQYAKIHNSVIHLKSLLLWSPNNKLLKDIIDDLQKALAKETGETKPLMRPADSLFF